MRSPDPKKLPEIIRRVRADYRGRGFGDRDIGNGLCESFAYDVLERWVGDDWIHREGQGFRTVETANFVIHDDDDIPMDWDWKLLRESWNITPPAGVSDDKLRELAQDCPTHVWITTHGRHYDAESSDGETSFFDLMFFRRWLNRE